MNKLTKHIMIRLDEETYNFLKIKAIKSCLDLGVITRYYLVKSIKTELEEHEKFLNNNQEPKT